MPGDERSDMADDRDGMPIPTEGDVEGDEAAPDMVTISPDAYSRVRDHSTSRLRPDDGAGAPGRRTPRGPPHPEAGAPPDAPLRASSPRPAARATSDVPPEPRDRRRDSSSWVWRRPVKRPRPLVVLCDISGSMERHSRLLLRFIQALSASSTVRTESFVFGTRLTRVTRLLKDRNRDRALTKVAEAVTDWAGGDPDRANRFRDFNHKWARRTLRSERRGHRRLGRLGPRRPTARRGRDGAPPTELPPARCGSIRWPGHRAINRSPPACARPIPTSTTSSPPGRWQASSASARSSPAAGPRTRGGAAAPRPTLPPAWTRPGPSPRRRRSFATPRIRSRHSR